MRLLFTTSLLILSLLSAQNSYELKDGSTINGTVLSETETEIKIETQFGIITISKSDILTKIYNIELNSGDSIFGEKIFEDEDIIRLNTNYGEVELNKSDVKSITEKGKKVEDKQVQPLYYPQRSLGLAGLLFGGHTMDKDSDFSLGEEQLIDLFFDPTGYTLDQGTLYLSGLSFGFGLSDKLQISSKWWNFFGGDLNLRPKFQVFEKGNWEKQQSLSIGAHIHSRWSASDKYVWKSGKIEDVPIFEGEWITAPSGSCDQYNDSEETDWCYQKQSETIYKDKYWGGWLQLEEEGPTIQENTEYESAEVGDYFDNSPSYQTNSNDYGWNNDGESYQMIEIFGAYTYSKARDNLKGRISHTIGANIQYANTSEGNIFYRAYYGIDVDINRKLKMIGEFFYDPWYVEIWDSGLRSEDYPDNLNDGLSEFSDSEVMKEDFSSLHLDFGFMYAFNESFRFGIHFQKPWVGFYWKF